MSVRRAREDTAEVHRPNRVLLLVLPVVVVATLAETWFVLLVLRWPRRETRGLLYLFLPVQAAAWLASTAFTDSLQRRGLTMTALGGISVECMIVVLDYAVLRLFTLLQSRKRTGEPISILDAATLAVAGNLVGFVAAIIAGYLVPWIWSFLRYGP